jgi:hypothetical protein
MMKARWSPYFGGVVLGLVVTVAMAIEGHRLSGAGAYQHLSGYVGARLAPDSIYWRHVVPTGLTWDVWTAIGGLTGAFIAALTSRTFKVRFIPDRDWQDTFGSGVAHRWVIAFVGAFLTEIGGGIAGGCTASLAVSGGAVLAPSAFLFMAAMFASGIPTAWLVAHAAEKRKP